MKLKIETETDIPSDWRRVTARKKTLVKIRPCNGVEKFKVSWQDAELVSDPKFDLIVIQPNGKEYPCKKDIFWETYEWTDWNTLMVECLRTYRKKGTTQLVEIPEGEEVEMDGTGNITKIKRGDMVRQRQLKIDARKWALSKMLPKKFGDKIQQEHSGEITTNVISLGSGIKPNEATT